MPSNNMKKRWISGIVDARPVVLSRKYRYDACISTSLKIWNAFFIHVLCCRSKDDASAKQLRQAADLLKSAAAVSLGMSIPVEEAALNATGAEANGSEDDLMTRHYSGLEIMENGHLGALKELVACYELGTPQSQQVGSIMRQMLICLKLGCACFPTVLLSCRGRGLVQSSSCI